MVVITTAVFLSDGCYDFYETKFMETQETIQYCFLLKTAAFNRSSVYNNIRQRQKSIT